MTRFENLLSDSKRRFGFATRLGSFSDRQLDNDINPLHDTKEEKPNGTSPEEVNVTVVSPTEEKEAFLFGMSKVRTICFFASIIILVLFVLCFILILPCTSQSDKNSVGKFCASRNETEKITSDDFNLYYDSKLKAPYFIVVNQVTNVSCKVTYPDGKSYKHCTSEVVIQRDNKVMYRHFIPFKPISLKCAGSLCVVTTNMTINLINNDVNLGIQTGSFSTAAQVFSYEQYAIVFPADEVPKTEWTYFVLTPKNEVKTQKIQLRSGHPAIIFRPFGPELLEFDQNWLVVLGLKGGVVFFKWSDLKEAKSPVTTFYSCLIFSRMWTFTDLYVLRDANETAISIILNSKLSMTRLICSVPLNFTEEKCVPLEMNMPDNNFDKLTSNLVSFQMNDQMTYVGRFCREGICQILFVTFNHNFSRINIVHRIPYLTEDNSRILKITTTSGEWLLLRMQFKILAKDLIGADKEIAKTGNCSVMIENVPYPCKQKGDLSFEGWKDVCSYGLYAFNLENILYPFRIWKPNRSKNLTVDQCAPEKSNTVQKVLLDECDHLVLYTEESDNKIDKVLFTQFRTIDRVRFVSSFPYTRKNEDTLFTAKDLIGNSNIWS